MKYSSTKVITLIVAIVLVISFIFVSAKFGGYFNDNNSQSSISSFNECAAAGYPIMESYPRQCRANGQLFVEVVSVQPSEPTTEPITSNGCAVAGCSGQLCVSADKASDIVTTCEYRAEYACYKEASCEPQASGECGWTLSADIRDCLSNSQESPQILE